jgi:magnesium chelatase family protein
MQVEMARVPPTELLAARVPENSATVARRVMAARSIALTRNGGRSNARLNGAAVQAACGLTRAATSSLADVAASRHLSARAVHRLLRVARTIADLEGRAQVSDQDVLAAGGLRDPVGPIDDRLAA